MTFGYDFLDRLTSVTGAYSQSFAYNQIGNITSMTISGTTSDYTYSAAHPHAVTAVGSISYAYDSNGNMTTRGSQSFTWDAENRLTGISDTIGGYSYDGDGNRVMKTENSVMTVYPNRYYEKDITNSVITTYYYLGDKLVANRQGTTLNYILQDHLGSTSATANSSGTQIAALAYYPWGGTRTSSGDLSTNKKFTGQRLDTTGLYYYGARYYDPSIGRFISPDTVVQDYNNPQSLNRYTYVLNNPLKYTDPTGHFADWIIDALTIAFDVSQMVSEPSWENGGYLAADVILGIVPFVPAGVGPAAKAIGKATEFVNTGKKVLNNFHYVYKYADRLNNALKSGLTPVIGKMKDLDKAKLGEKEFKVADFIPDQGDDFYNTLQNQAALDEIIKSHSPVKDISVDAKTGKLNQNTGYLKMERDYLTENNYYYDRRTQIWYPGN